MKGETIKRKSKKKKSPKLKGVKMKDERQPPQDTAACPVQSKG